MGTIDALLDFVLPGVGHVKTKRYNAIQGGIVLAGSAALGLLTSGIGYLASGIYHAAKTYKIKR